MDPATTSGARPALEDRTDLIAQASAHDAMQSPGDRGTLRTYLGIAPGSGEDLRDVAGRTAPGRRSGVDTVECPMGAARAAGDGCPARRSGSASCPCGPLPGRELC